jgi:AcrR family transcriptional regulator
MPKVLPEYLEQRRQQIQDAAAACFARKGFHQTTMQDICEEAVLSPGAVYRYFHSKEEIIEAMCARGQEQNAELVQAALGRGATSEVFDELIQVFFGAVASGDRDIETCALNVELIAEAPRNERIRESLTRSNFEVRSRFVDLVRRAQAAGDINPGLDADAVARVMIATYHGFITQKLVQPDLDILAYAQVLRALFGGAFWTGGPGKAIEAARADAALSR